jgi:NADH:ubiquinone oxidoreductase subunit 4 (subunit M)
MPFPILSSLVVLPIVGVLLLFLVPNDEEHAGLTRRVARVGARVRQTLMLWFRFNGASGDFQFTERTPGFPRSGSAISSASTASVSCSSC